MSGGVGHIGLTSQENQQKLPQNQDQETFQESQQEQLQETPPKTHLRRRPPFLTFRQLNMAAVILVLAASGMVAVGDFLFVIFSFTYMFFISKVAFPTISPSASPSPPIFAGNHRFFRLYVGAGALIGLVLPVAYIIEGILEGDKEGIKAATPHVFLLASQVFMEGVTFSGSFSLPIRVFVPVVYNSVRVSSLMEWVRSEMEKVEGGGRRRLWMGRGLAMVNLGFWSFNLFGFLLPVYLPRAFRKYYEDERKVKD